MSEEEKGTGFESAQADHYDRIASLYESHYDDACSAAYRRRFVYEPMFEGLDLSGKHVLEAMCGSGQATGFLLDRGCQVTGLDISTEMIESFKTRWPSAHPICASFLDSGLPDESFDAIVSVGGFHHLQPEARTAFEEAHRLLKPGGDLLFWEPHKGSIPDLVRGWWMKRDSYFEENEDALDLDALQAAFADRFETGRPHYGGNLGYLFIFNSMIFRVPLWLKPVYSPFLMRVESVSQHFQGKRLSCFVLGRWRKKKQ